MVRQLLFCLTLCGLWSTGLLAGQYRLWLTAPPNEDIRQLSPELGTPFTLWLHYQGPADLDRIDTEPWQAHVAISQGYAKRHATQQSLRLRITPRAIGLLQLPALRLGGAQTAPLQLQILPATEQGDTLSPSWQVSEKTAWQRQTLSAEITLDLTTADARLEVDALRTAGVDIHAFPLQRETLNNGLTRYRFAWRLRPQQPGTLILEAPVLRYIHDGVPRRRFQFPPHTVTVSALPPYVTPTVPVGQTHQASPGGAIIGKGIDPATLNAALARAGFTATAQAKTGFDLALQTEARIDWHAAMPNTTGLVYFDPVIGRLQALHPRAPDNSRWITASISAVLLILLLGWQRKRLRNRWQLHTYRHQLRKTLNKALTAGDTQSALLALCVPGELRPPQTLNHWLTTYSRLSNSAPLAREQQILQLESALYSKTIWPKKGARLLAACL